MRDLLNETERERDWLSAEELHAEQGEDEDEEEEQKEKRDDGAHAAEQRDDQVAQRRPVPVLPHRYSQSHHIDFKARQNQTLARPAAPLAERISSVGRTNKNWWSWQRPLTDWKTNFRLSVPVKRTTTRHEQQTRVTLGRRVCNVGSGNVGLKTYYSRDAGGDQLNFLKKKTIHSHYSVAHTEHLFSCCYNQESDLELLKNDLFYAWKHAVCHSGVRSWTHSYQKRVSNNGKRDRDEAAITRCKAKPVGSPPGYLPSWLFIIVNVGQLSAALALLVVRRHLTNRMRTQFCGPGPQHWLPRQRLLQKRKTNFTTFIYSHSSTNPENLGKIGLGDVEIIGATRSLKINTKQRQNVSPPSEQTWWL